MGVCAICRIAVLRTRDQVEACSRWLPSRRSCSSFKTGKAKGDASPREERSYCRCAKVGGPQGKMEVTRSRDGWPIIRPTDHHAPDELLLQSVNIPLSRFANSRFVKVAVDLTNASKSNKILASPHLPQ